MRTILLMLSLCPLWAEACTPEPSGNMFKFNDSIYYFSEGEYLQNTSEFGCPHNYGAGPGFSAYIPGIQTELELLRLQYVFESELRTITQI